MHGFDQSVCGCVVCAECEYMVLTSLVCPESECMVLTSLWLCGLFRE